MLLDTPGVQLLASATPESDKKVTMSQQSSYSSLHSLPSAPLLDDGSQEELAVPSRRAHPADSEEWQDPHPISHQGSKIHKGRSTPLFGNSRVRVVPAPEDSPVFQRRHTPDAWLELNESAQPDSLHGNKQMGRRTALFGKKTRVAPVLEEEEGTGRRTPDLSIFAAEGSRSSLVTIEETTGEKIVEPLATPTLSNEIQESVISATKREPDMPQMTENEQQPYIPLVFAQEALTQVVNDMHKMKEDHIVIVGQIKGAYKEIEEESQVQYRSFVQHLKQQHASKVAIYKQIVKLLQEEIDRMKEHWEGTTKSLANRNKELLEENRGLYRKIKDSISQMESEKEQAISQLTKRLDKERKRQTADLQTAQQTIKSLQARYTEDVQQALEEERTAHQLALKELERRLSLVEVEGATERERKPPETQMTSFIDTALGKSVNVSQRELQMVRGQLQSMLDLFSSEPNFYEALETTSNELQSDINALRTEKQAVEQQVAAWSLQYQATHNGQEPAMSEWGESALAAKYKLDHLTKEVSGLEDKFRMFHSIQQGKVPPSLRPSIVATPCVDVEAREDDSEFDETISDVGEEPEPLDTEESEEDSESEEEGVRVESGTMEEDKQPPGPPQTDELPEQEESRELRPVEDRQKIAMGHEVAKKLPPKSQQSQRVETAQLPAGKQVDVKSQQAVKKLREQITELKKEQQSDIAKIKALEKELKSSSKAAGASADEKKELKRKEKELKDVTRQHDVAKKNLEKIQGQLKASETELSTMKKENERLLEEAKSSGQELQKLAVAAKEGIEAAERLKALEVEVKRQAAELRTVSDSYNSERILRKKYYNMIEDMKGKIRVYCRARPLSQDELARKNYSVTESSDEYTVSVRTARGSRDFQFDQIFTEAHSQERIFADSKNLIQSAVDGFNVCIFAYGQTGSGKTYTMIGGKDASNTITAPGIAPRAFETIFHLTDVNRSKFNFSISCYMLELYNDRLLDLFQTSRRDVPKLDIKKDKKGLVYVQGAVSHPVTSATELMKRFEMGSRNRHVASTKMNAESSRSHLIIGILIESTNLTNGVVHRGKLSLVDLAGSERASKTESSAEQLKEAQSINKSLSALGDVISALSSGQDFVPYRNNKLTLLMQDSLGGNAKTLMFVNISPADYNREETVISLTYAARVKLITNDATKNAENREVSRLKATIARLQKGEAVTEDEI